MEKVDCPWSLSQREGKEKEVGTREKAGGEGEEQYREESCPVDQALGDIGGGGVDGAQGRDWVPVTQMA